MHKLRKSVISVFVTMFILVGCSLAGTNTAKGNTTINIRIGKTSFKAVIYDNETGKALIEKLPVEYKMSELNGNEKYKYLSYELPTDEQSVGKIKAGDIMLYGSDCLVVFYESFDTSYKYTRIGRITDTKGLSEAAGSGEVTVKFTKKKTTALTYNRLTMKVGTKKTIKLIGAKTAKVKWSTSNKSIATVSKGKIKAKKKGKVTITAKYKRKKYKCKVTVKKQIRENTVTKNNTAERIGQTSGDAGGIAKGEGQTSGDAGGIVINNNEQSADNSQHDFTGNGEKTMNKELTLKIGETNIKVDWEDNESVEAIKEIVAIKPLSISMSMYGGFEQVGSIGKSIPKNDTQITTSSGDIVLYSGNQIVIFYGSNSWSYTRLGHISDLDKEELNQLLGDGDVTITIGMEE
jgi:hypothetical protein